MKTNEDLTPEHSIAQNGKSFHWAGRFLGPRLEEMQHASIVFVAYLMIWQMEIFQMGQNG